ncbi:TonB-dependent receptor [Marinirhabdus gelatinilytica]|uniref:Iron complex outermembrane receptor protein n=1 Tax=Marinirhabdus gelatinilytica TaxID=1703343 RepID=A0A370QG60_9FLAO|nr:TonB-dependent receptor [Marinirhabdus gelatinilytica]RDK87351.1 iron complex outermembrane receptor protein [Marinirhabdus gelatinilytica]
MSTVICLTVFFYGNAQIVGNVTDAEGNPIADVSVIFDNEEISRTDASGTFQLKEKFALPLQVSFSHPDYFFSEELVEKNNSAFQLRKITVNNELSTVVLASDFNKKSRILAPTETITSEDLERFDPVDVVDALNQTEGIYIQNGAINTNRITIRGVGSRTLFGTNKIRAYFNGIPITNGSGSTEIDSYNTNALASIEVVKGPKATQYGTNLGGTLILSTTTPTENTTKITNNFTVGSFGLLKNSTTALLKEDRLTLFANYDHLQVDGFRENNRYNRNNYLVTSNYQLNKTFSLGLLLRHTNNFTQIASSLGETAFTENPTQAAFTWGQAMGFEDNRETLSGLSLETKISETFNNTTSVYYTYLDHYEPRPFNILEEYTHSYGLRSIFVKQYTLAKRNATLSFGGETYRDDYNGRIFENLYEENNGNGSFQGSLLGNNNEIREQLNVFATTTIPFSEKWKTEIGVNVNSTRYELMDKFNTGDANTSANRDFETLVAPNFSLQYQPSQDWALYGNVSRGFNYPSVEETLTPDGIVNPDIGPEIGWNYELGTKAKLLNRKLQFKVAAYLLSIDDLLVAERVGNDQFVGRNAGKTHNRGIEFGAEYTSTVLKNITLQAYVNADFNFHKFIDFVDGENDFSGNELTGVPDKKIAAGIRFQHPIGLYILANTLHVGSQPITDANNIFSDSYTIANVKAGYEGTLVEKLKITMSAGINNMADITYASSILINATAFGGNEPRYFYPAPPINFYGSLGIQYQL